jgi:hypothetical protein
VEQQVGIRVKSLPSDNGGEFASKDWDNYMLQLGIQHIRVPPDAHAQNVNAFTLPSSTWFGPTSLTPVFPSVSGPRQLPMRHTHATGHLADLNLSFQMTSGWERQSDMIISILSVLQLIFATTGMSPSLLRAA